MRRPPGCLAVLGTDRGSPSQLVFCNSRKGGWKTPSPPADMCTAGELPPCGETRLSRKARSSASSVPRPGSAGCGATPWGHLPSMFPAHQDSHLDARTPNPRPSGGTALSASLHERPPSDPGLHEATGGRQAVSLVRAAPWPSEGSCPEAALRAQSLHLTCAEPRPGLAGQAPSSECPHVGQGAGLRSGSPWGRGHTNPPTLPQREPRLGAHCAQVHEAVGVQGQL